MKLLVFALVLLLSRVCAADFYSWDDCVKLVSETNPALLSGTIGYNYTNSLTVSSGSNVVLNNGGNGQSSGSYQLTGSATQNIFNGLQDMAKIDQGKAQEEVARANLESVKAQISYNLKTNFGYLLYAKREVDLAVRIADRRATNLRLVELRFRDGQENKGSVLLYEAYLKDAKYGVTQAHDNVLSGQVQLAQALGLTDYQSVDVKGDVPLHPLTVKVSELSPLALKSPTYESAVGQEHVADAGVTLARAGFFPTLGVSAGIGTSGPWFPDNNHWSLGVALTIPIFNGGRDYYATASAIQSRVAAEKTRNDVLHQTNAAIANAYTNYVEAIENVSVCQAYLDADQVRVEIARADYKNGLMSFTDWDLVETDLITREKNLLQAEQTRVTAEATWEQALGQGVLP
jgi:outer membrane protein